MAADANRLAAALAYEDERKRRLAETIPALTGPTTAPRRSVRTDLENLSAGLGQGITTQLEGIKGLITDPVGTAKGAYEAARAVVRDPSVLAAALSQMGQKAMSGPLGAGEVIGEMIGPRKTGPVMAELDVYHGTPHRFPATEANPLGEFDASKIGTGEGAQAYGHGIYYAENPKVAKGYQSSLSADRGFSFEGKSGLTRAEVQDMVNAKYGKGYLDNILRPSGVADSFIDDMVTGVTRAEGTYPKQYKAGSERAKLYDELRGKITHASPGTLYKADLPDEMIDRMLDWDKPLSEQPAAVRESLRKLGKEHPLMFGPPDKLWKFRDAINDPNLTGAQIHKQFEDLFGSQKVSGALMRQAGIPGIKYLDEGSRNTAGKWIAKHPQGGETAFNTEAELNAFLKRNPEMAAVKPKQTRNFVVFPDEEKKVRILERK